jgi:hypothetical protein
MVSRRRFGEFGTFFDHDAVFQIEIRKNVADAMLRQLLDVVAGDLTAKDDSLGSQLDREIANAPSGSQMDLVFQLNLQRRR